MNARKQGLGFKSRIQNFSKENPTLIAKSRIQKAINPKSVIESSIESSNLNNIKVKYTSNFNDMKIRIWIFNSSRVIHR